MKRTNCLVLFLIFCLSLSYGNAQANENDSNGQITLDPSQLPRQKKRPVFSVKITNDTAWQSSYDSKNKLPLVEGSAVINRTDYTLSFSKFDLHLATEAVVPTTNDPDMYVGSFQIGLQKNFRKTQVEARNSFYFKHRQKFGVSELEVRKFVPNSEKATTYFFTNVSGFYKLDDLNNRATNGFTWSGGAKFERSISNSVKLSISPYVIADRNALQKGKRTSANFEVEFLFHFRRLYIGPKVEYTYFLSDSSASLEKRQHAMYGIVWKVR